MVYFLSALVLEQIRDWSQRHTNWHVHEPWVKTAQSVFTQNTLVFYKEVQFG